MALIQGWVSATPASMLEMVDEADSKSVGGDTVWVQVPLLAPLLLKEKIMYVGFVYVTQTTSR